MKYVLVFHANLLYCNLPEEKYEFVIRNSYEKIHDMFAEKFPHARYVFDASGWTLEKMLQYCPDVVEKFKDACKKNCEFAGGPYGHHILANFPREDALKSLTLSMETYDRILGFTPKTFSNPECSWRSWVGEVYKSVGAKNLICDWDSYLISTDSTVRAMEYNPSRTAKDGKHLPYYNISPDTKSFHFPMNIVPGLKGVMRSDRMCNEVLWYLMGQSEEHKHGMPVKPSLDNVMKAIDYWSGKNKQGILMPYAEDAEYVGTTAYFYLKYYNQYRLFEDSPESLERTEAFIEALLKRGELITVSDAMEQFPALEDETIRYEEGIAWHRTFSDAWAATPQSRMMDGDCWKLHYKIKKAEHFADTPEKQESVQRAWRYLLLGENSDGRWPPPPMTPADYDVQFCLDNINACAKELRWVDEINTVGLVNSKYESPVKAF